MAGKKEKPWKNDTDLEEKFKKLRVKSSNRREITRNKRLKELQEKIEGSHEIERVKKLKRKLLIPQILGIIILFPFLMYFNESSLDPFYMPVYHSILMLFGWILIIIIGSIIFRILRIKRHRSYSIKYLLARNSMRKSIVLAVVALIIFGVIYTPYLTGVINDASSIEDNIFLAEDEREELELTTRCRLNFRRLESVYINTTNNVIIHVSIYEKETSDIVDQNNGSSYFFEDFDTTQFQELIVHINSSEDIYINYQVRQELFPSRQLSFSILSFFYMGVFAQSSAIFYPIKKKYTGEGIYR